MSLGDRTIGIRFLWNKFGIFIRAGKILEVSKVNIRILCKKWTLNKHVHRRPTSRDPFQLIFKKTLMATMTTPTPLQLNIYFLYFMIKLY